ncbi:MULTISPECIES: hypothetical protein [unclassified Streptomyces]|uniref:hypothetical protein n=1 Tax=unclassified Streptomyces TaxID=2593676 RepID=UPI0033B06BD0
MPVRGNPEEPENEVEDFPVMWAAPGTLPRTVPWQLDPSRRPDSYATDAVLTDRRLVFLGTQQGTLSKADELWEVLREDMAEARQMKYSEIGGDVRITFRNGSWIRLFTVRRTAPKNAEPPTFTLLKSGIVQVECRVPAKAGQGLFETHSILMSPSGGPAKPKPGDL